MGSSTSLQSVESKTPATSSRSRPFSAPPVDVYENDDELLIVADMPDVRKEDINIHLDKGQLTLEGQKPESNEPGKVLLREYRDQDLRRSFSIPQGIDTEKVSAEHSNGVLRVHLPKSAAVRPRQIPVKAG